MGGEWRNAPRDDRIPEKALAYIKERITHHVCTGVDDCNRDLVRRREFLAAGQGLRIV